MSSEPGIHVVCENCYNNGKEVGGWIYENDAFDLINLTPTVVHRIFGDYESETCENVRIIDCENIPIHGELSLKQAQAWFEAYRNLSFDWDIFLAYATQIIGTVYAEPSDVLLVEDKYRGDWDSFTEFAKNLIEEADLLHGVPNYLLPYFDYESYADDLEEDYYVIENRSHRVDVFSAN